MKRASVVGAALAIAGLGFGSVPASAQATLGWDAALFSSYVWRGVTYTNKPVLQPDLYLTFPLGKASLTAGGWANVDIAKYDDVNNDISESGGTSAFNLAEFDWWGEVAVPVGGSTITGGVTGYIFPNDFGFTKASNTVEVYGKLALGLPVLNPKINAYYDVDKVKGLYVEGSVSHGIPLGAISLNLGALAGWTGGQEKGSDPSWNFADKGLTHVDLSASTSFAAGPLSIAPSIHGVITHDANTKITKPTKLDSGFKLWGGFTISWSHVLGSKAEGK